MKPKGGATAQSPNGSTRRGAITARSLKGTRSAAANPHIGVRAKTERLTAPRPSGDEIARTEAAAMQSHYRDMTARTGDAVMESHY